MSDRLMTPADLERVTGKKRHINQADWFRDRFGYSPVTCGDGSLIVTWATFEALNKKHAGLAYEESTRAIQPHRPPLRSIK